MLKGKQFFSFQLVPIVESALNLATQLYMAAIDQMDGGAANQWRGSVLDATTFLMELNKRADDDSMSSNPTSYTEITPLWQRAESVLSPFSGQGAIVAAVAELPPDVHAIPGPTWTMPALVGGGLLAVIGIGYWWTRR